MVGDGIPGAGGGDRRGRRRSKRPPGLAVVARDGFWHVVGTVRLTDLGGTRRARRIRQSTGLPARPDTRADAEAARDSAALAARNEIVHGVQPSRPLSVALELFLKRPRRNGRGPGWREVRLTQDIGRAFGIRLATEISAAEWTTFIDGRCAGVSPATRERFLNGLFSFLNWCAHRSRQWITDKTIPYVERDQAARKPRHRQRRRVAEWRPELILLLIDSAGWHLKPQLWVEWSTGQRAGAVLKPRLADVVLAPGREQITFPTTKTGEPVTASLHPGAAEAIRQYLKRRGRLWDREGPLFLTKAGKPYKTENDLSGHNRTAFNNAKRKANAVRRRQALQAALDARRDGDVAGARAIAGQAWADLRLMRLITQHWFRHLLATTMMAMRAPLRVGMDQGGWLEVESYMAYAHDVEEVRRSVVDQLPIGTPAKKESA